MYKCYENNSDIYVHRTLSNNLEEMHNIQIYGFNTGCIKQQCLLNRMNKQVIGQS